MKTLRISPDLALPLDWITLATVVYGARGSGKTSFGRVAAEEATKARQRFCGIDLKGDWSGLKSSADGKSEGIPVIIFGGDHADVPLEPDAGAFVGETVAKLEQSCILDFELLSKGKQIRFLAEFFEALYHHNREPLLLLLDEAQRYAPQKPGPDEARTLGAVQDLVKLGRKHGIGPVLFTQRGAGLSKEVSELCDMLVAFRTPGPLDQDRIKDWLDANTTKTQRDQVMRTLAGLETGTAVFASGHPDLKLFGVYNVRRPETFDSSATPKVGQRRAEPKKFAAPDLKEIREKMAAAIERRKADDPKALRARIAELEREAAKKPTPKVELVEVPILGQATTNALANTAEEMRKLGVDLVETARGIREALQPVGAPLPQRPTLAHPESDHTPKPARVQENNAPASSRSRPNMPKAGGRMTLDRRIMTVLAQYQGRGMTRGRLAVHLGTHPNTKSLVNMLGSLRSTGWVDGLAPTAEGLAALGNYEPLPTGDALFAMWCEQKLAPAEARVLRAIAERGDWTRDELAAHLGLHPNTKSLVNTLGKLRGLGLVEGLRLSEELAE